MRRLTSLMVLVGALLVLGATVSSADTGTTSDPTSIVPATDSAATTAVQPATATTTAATLTLELSATTASFVERIDARGSLSPEGGGKEIALEIGGGAVWSQLATATTDGFGSYAVSFDALAAGSIRARAVETGMTSTPVPLAVVPVVRAKVSRARAFAGATLTAAVTPATYEGRVTVTVRRDGKAVGRARAWVKHGQLKVKVPTPGVGTLWAELLLPASGVLSERALGVKIVAPGRTISVGSTGPEVPALRRRLAELRFHVPGPSATFSSSLYDSVIAFQKAYDLSRTGVVDATTWRRLERAQLVEPRYKGPSPHIEVDKTRQILLVVRGGKVAAILPASTGATGNTPEGRHQIRWKAPATTTWLGSGILYRTLTFFGNSFAIHGWYSVPAYPASHGCVRIPIWAADWLYNQSPVGETVYVYR